MKCLSMIVSLDNEEVLAHCGVVVPINKVFQVISFNKFSDSSFIIILPFSDIKPSR